MAEKKRNKKETEKENSEETKPQCVWAEKFIFGVFDLNNKNHEEDIETFIIMHNYGIIKAR